LSQVSHLPSFGVFAVVAGAAVHQPHLLEVVVVHAHTVGWGAGSTAVMTVVPRLAAVLITSAVRDVVAAAEVAADEAGVLVVDVAGGIGVRGARVLDLPLAVHVAAIAHALHAPEEWRLVSCAQVGVADGTYSCSCARAGHASPELQGSTVTARARVLMPWPQVVEHAPYCQPSSTWQSTTTPSSHPSS
jgi:hypothetical protein